MDRNRTIHRLIEYLPRKENSSFRGCGSSCTLNSIRSSPSALSPGEEMTLRSAAKILSRLGDEHSGKVVLNALKQRSGR